MSEHSKTIHVAIHEVLDANGEENDAIIKKVEEVVVKNASGAIKIIQSIHIKNDNGSIKQVYERLRTVEFANQYATAVTTGQDRRYTADSNNNFYDIDLDNYFNVDDKRGRCKITINSGVHLIPTSAAKYGIRTGGSYGKYILEIINEGDILGFGGAGGRGGSDGGGNGAAGGDGSPAFLVEADVTLSGSGNILGGGGGGGGGAGARDDDFWSGDENAPGGGGGGGQCYGPGGDYGSGSARGATAGSAGTDTSPGYGGAGGYDSGYPGARAGAGGAGGAVGQDGQRGYEDTEGDSGGSAGLGGDSGDRYINPSSYKINGAIV
jgi:hypothetical protein